MPVDPSDPETFDSDEAVDLTEIDVEAPEEDAAEQHHDVAPSHDTAVTGGDADPDAADEADRAEQARVVELNEDEYR